MKKLLIAMLICGVSYGYSQDFEAGLYFGGSFYSGDLSPKAIPRYTNFIEPAGGIVARVRGRGVVAARLSIMYTNLWGDDRKGAIPGRGLAFSTRLLEGSAMAEWYLIPDNYIGDRPKISPYLMGGITVFNFRPKVEHNGQIIDLNALGTEGQGLEGYPAPYRTTQLAIPYGAGVRFEIKRRSAIQIEITGRKTFTDHLDDVGGNYVDYQRLLEEKGTLAAELSNPAHDPDKGNIFYKRGGNRLDAYAVFGISYTYQLNR